MLSNKTNVQNAFNVALLIRHLVVNETKNYYISLLRCIEGLVSG